MSRKKKFHLLKQEIKEELKMRKRMRRFERSYITTSKGMSHISGKSTKTITKYDSDERSRENQNFKTVKDHKYMQDRSKTRK